MPYAHIQIHAFMRCYLNRHVVVIVVVVVALLWLAGQSVAGSGLANSKMMKDPSSSATAAEGSAGTSEGSSTAATVSATTAPAAEAAAPAEEKKEGDDPSDACCYLIYTLYNKNTYPLIANVNPLIANMYHLIVNIYSISISTRWTSTKVAGKRWRRQRRSSSQWT